MHKTPALLAALTLSVAALAGCSAGNLEDATPELEVSSSAQAHVEALSEGHNAKEMRDYLGDNSDRTAPPTPNPGPSFPGDSPSFENDWAKKQLEDYMTYQGANSLHGFAEGSPERNIVAVTNPSDGVVRFEVADRDYEADGWYLEGLAANYMSWTGCAAEDVESVLVETAGGGDSVTQTGCP